MHHLIMSSQPVHFFALAVECKKSLTRQMVGIFRIRPQIDPVWGGRVLGIKKQSLLSIVGHPDETWEPFITSFEPKGFI